MLHLLRRYPDEAGRAAAMVDDPSQVRAMADHALLYGHPRAAARLDFLFDPAAPVAPRRPPPPEPTGDPRDDLQGVLRRYLDDDCSDMWGQVCIGALLIWGRRWCPQQQLFAPGQAGATSCSAARSLGARSAAVGSWRPSRREGGGGGGLRSTKSAEPDTRRRGPGGGGFLN
ncbi:MAG TPA: hypothetical protein VFS43_27615 [Polyangiaceae bacterium]|nr:hypothetical protein [Polyangiaceae bacterium]